jgi:8-oxo-dGTP diphosphatase
VSPREYIEPTQWYAGLPTVYVSVCVLITDPQERVLMVKPNYRDYWAIPGGIIEEGESPERTAAREVAEELGLVIPIGDLLVFDWAPPMGARPKVMTNLIFDGGTLHDPGLIRLQEDELDDFAFLPWDQAAERLPANTSARIPAALKARKDQRTVYLPTASP